MHVVAIAPILVAAAGVARLWYCAMNPGSASFAPAFVGATTDHKPGPRRLPRIST
jgi:hypothetical protein